MRTGLSGSPLRDDHANRPSMDFVLWLAENKLGVVFSSPIKSSNIHKDRDSLRCHASNFHYYRLHNNKNAVL